MSGAPPDHWQKQRWVKRGTQKWVNWRLNAWVTKNRGEAGCHVGFNRVYIGLWDKSPKDCMVELDRMPQKRQPTSSLENH